MIRRYTFLAILFAAINLFLSFYFRENSYQLLAPTIETANWFFIAEPIYNWGGFFVDGSEPTIQRLPTTLFLVWACACLLKYLEARRSWIQGMSSAILLGGLGGLTLDILAYGSVCDWLGFSLPGSPIYSMLNICDLMILVSAPVASILCIERWYLRLLSFLFALTVIGANSYYHLQYLIF